MAKILQVNCFICGQRVESSSSDAFHPSCIVICSICGSPVSYSELDNGLHSSCALGQIQKLTKQMLPVKLPQTNLNPKDWSIMVFGAVIIFSLPLYLISSWGVPWTYTIILSIFPILIWIPWIKFQLENRKY